MFFTVLYWIVAVLAGFLGYYLVWEDLPETGSRNFFRSKVFPLMLATIVCCLILLIVVAIGMVGFDRSFPSSLMVGCLFWLCVSWGTNWRHLA